MKLVGYILVFNVKEGILYVDLILFFGFMVGILIKCFIYIWGFFFLGFNIDK